MLRVRAFRGPVPIACRTSPTPPGRVSVCCLGAVPYPFAVCKSYGTVLHVCNFSINDVLCVFFCTLLSPWGIVFVRFIRGQPVFFIKGQTILTCCEPFYDLCSLVLVFFVFCFLSLFLTTLQDMETVLISSSDMWKQAAGWIWPHGPWFARLVLNPWFSVPDSIVLWVELFFHFSVDGDLNCL